MNTLRDAMTSVDPKSDGDVVTKMQTESRHGTATVDEASHKEQNAVSDLWNNMNMQLGPDRQTSV